ncbi:DUF1129 family protein [Bacillus sp. BGMRC 2118]|nr:DUF1129 family protein [Bacillus sp. BGMRC 2118]
MNATTLIEQNNVKRKELTPENERYYSDMLIYIRLQLSLSELQSEEVLMEMLDHLLEGQEVGKSAKNIFGDDPKKFADVVIEQLPKEKKRAVVPFVGGIIGNIVGWILTIRGILLLVTLPFKEVETTVYPLSLIGLALVIAVFVMIAIIYILKLVQRSLFTEKKSTRVDTVKAGLAGALGMGAVLITARFLPEAGPSFDFSWLPSLVSGGVILIGMNVYKRIKQNKQKQGR